MSGIPGTAALGRIAALTLIMCSSMSLISPVQAQQSAPEPQTAVPSSDPGQAVWNAAQTAMLHGPDVVQLNDQAKLSLPEGYSFVPKKEAAAVMELMGNQTDARFIGMITPDTDASWFATVEYEPSGYIEDGDAKDWDAGELLESLKEGTKEANKQRVEQGITPIEVTKWVEVPTYDSPQHRLVWSAEAREIGVQDPDPTINYNTYVLGREGYISVNMITSSSQIEKDKPIARQLLAGIEFNAGKRYTDFDEATDKVAGYGLAALVGGLAAKKLGLLGLLGVMLVKFGKIILIAIAAVGGIVAKMFKRGEPAQG
jgi:uncharacterized membrane-anchored protein